uniref:Phospholipid-binding lipoprotein MlaA n=1 Tax=Candidatus Kentrum sp. FW TaxID=2126338 RepID=A0A450U0U2_9GAMM|nr:MAG: phospholipid-binding lipoprotein MlaA [Candidatus Kentron sp. FW]
MNGKNRPGIGIILFLFLYILTNGCVGSEIDEEWGDGDPLEDTNRVFYGVNDILDDVLLEPIAETYVDYTPAVIQSGISNFFDNLAYPGVIINNILQGKIGHGLEGIGRFLINTILGIGGLFDPATHLGFERHQEDLGQTLGTWGAGEGGYLVVPLVGPNSVRDVPGLVANLFTNLLYYAESSVMFPLFVIDAIDRRADYLTVTRLRDQVALDPYLFTREGYRERRKHLIYDGDVPEEYEEYEEE